MHFRVRRSLRPVSRVLLVMLGALAPVRGAPAQNVAPFTAGSGLFAASAAPLVVAETSKTFFVRRDAEWAAVAIVGTALLSTFDKRIAHWTQTAGVQGSSTRHRVVDDLTRINETTLTLGAILGYGIGRLTHSKSVADVSLHTGEAVVLTSVISQVIRGPLGRERPSVSPNDQYRFDFGKGFTQFNNRAFPSLHSATGFAAATAINAEIHERNPQASWYVTPIAYSIALVPGLTRMYLNQHWASDVVSGAFVGTLIGNRVVHYAHSHEPNKLDRALLGSTVMPNGHGFTATVSWVP